jgi:hypothetical protein
MVGASGVSVVSRIGVSQTGIRVRRVVDMASADGETLTSVGLQVCPFWPAFSDAGIRAVPRPIHIAASRSGSWLGHQGNPRGTKG